MNRTCVGAVVNNRPKTSPLARSGHAAASLGRRRSEIIAVDVTSDPTVNV